MSGRLEQGVATMLSAALDLWDHEFNALRAHLRAIATTPVSWVRTQAVSGLEQCTHCGHDVKDHVNGNCLFGSTAFTNTLTPIFDAMFASYQRRHPPKPAEPTSVEAKPTPENT